MSKFSSLMQAKRPLSQAPEDFNKLFEEADAKKEDRASQKESNVLEQTVQQPSTIIAKGKKGHPAYNQVTVYLKKETHNKAKIALLKNGSTQDFSELVERLLCDFLEV